MTAQAAVMAILSTSSAVVFAVKILDSHTHLGCCLVTHVLIFIGSTLYDFRMPLSLISPRGIFLCNCLSKTVCDGPSNGT